MANEQKKFNLAPVILPPLIMVVATLVIGFIVGFSYGNSTGHTFTSSNTAVTTNGTGTSGNAGSTTGTNGTGTSSDSDAPTKESMHADIEKAFANAVGNYSDGNGNTVNIENSEKMVRTLAGGGETHVYDEKITGFQVLDGGYLINVQWEDSKYSYKCIDEDGVTKLYVDFDDEWNADYNNFNYNEVQIFTKE